MIPDLDVFRTANILVKQHGQDAPTVPGPKSPLKIGYFAHKAVSLWLGRTPVASSDWGSVDMS